MVGLVPSGVEVLTLTMQVENVILDRGADVGDVVSHTRRFLGAYATLRAAYDRSAQSGQGGASREMLEHIDGLVQPLLDTFQYPASGGSVPDWRVTLAESTTAFVAWMERIVDSKDWSASREALLRLPRLYVRHCNELGIAFIEPHVEREASVGSDRDEGISFVMGIVPPAEERDGGHVRVHLVGDGAALSARSGSDTAPPSLSAA